MPIISLIEMHVASVRYLTEILHNKKMTEMNQVNYHLHTSQLSLNHNSVMTSFLPPDLPFPIHIKFIGG